MSVCGYLVTVKDLIANFLEQHGLGITVNEISYYLARQNFGYKVLLKILPSGLAHGLVFSSSALPGDGQKDVNQFVMFAKDQKDRWKPYESLVKDAGVCMFNKDEKTFSMRSLYDSPPAKPEEVAQRFRTYFEGKGFKTEERSSKPGVITRAYDKGDKTYLVVTHMTTDNKKVDSTVVEYKPGVLK